MEWLSRVDHGHWIRWPIGGIGTSWIGGILAEIPYTNELNAVAIGILGIGSACLGLWRLYEVQTIRIREQRRISEIHIAEEERASLARVPQVTIVQPLIPPAGPKP